MRGNFFKQFEDYIAKEESRRAQDVLESDLLGSTDSPKEIEIHCPQVSICLNPIFHKIIVIGDKVNHSGSSCNYKGPYR